MQAGGVHPSDDAGIEQRNLMVTDVYCSSLVSVPEIGRNFLSLSSGYAQFCVQTAGFGKAWKMRFQWNL